MKIFEISLMTEFWAYSYEEAQQKARYWERWMKKADYISELQGGVCKIVFDKEDGTERIMFGTLREDVIPSKPMKQGVVTSKVKGNVVVNNQEGILSSDDLNPDIVKLWDTEREGWRSFVIDRVKTFEKV